MAEQRVRVDTFGNNKNSSSINEKELIKASESGDIAMAKKLIEHEVDIFTRNDDDMTPLEIAVQYDHTEIVRLLLKNEPDDVVQDDEYYQDHYNALLQAVTNGNIEIVRLLLNHGLDLNEGIENYEETPLIEAIEANQTKMVQFMLEQGADLAENLSSLEIAIKNGNIEIVRLLINYGFTVNEDLIEAIRANQTKMVQILLEQGADPNSYDFGGYTILIMAIVAHNIEIVQLLLWTLIFKPV